VITEDGHAITVIRFGRKGLPRLARH
jgi:hypothetical protein